MSRPSELVDNLERLNAAKAALRMLCMEFNADGKMRAAQWFGLPFDAFFGTPYHQWYAIEEEFLHQVREPRP